MSSTPVLRITRVALFIFWATVAITLLRGVQDSPLRLTRGATMNMVALSPQGWAFFTRNPREERTYLYARRGEDWVPYTVTTADPSNLFGLRKRSRGHEMELASILGQVPQASWVKGRLDVEGLKGKDFRRGVVVENRFPRSTMCGEFVVQKRPPVPWAWSRLPKPVIMPSRTAKLLVRCAADAGGAGRRA
jgi:antimicrobial peptide system SdpA family protein